MKTDIERLHQVYEGNLKGRAVGKTFLQCHEIAGQIEVGEVKNIICLLPNYQYTVFIKTMLIDVLKEHGIIIKKHTRDTIFISGGKRILFLVRSLEEDELIGFTDYCTFWL